MSLQLQLLFSLAACVPIRIHKTCPGVAAWLGVHWSGCSMKNRSQNKQIFLFWVFQSPQNVKACHSYEDYFSSSSYCYRGLNPVGLFAFQREIHFMLHWSLMGNVCLEYLMWVIGFSGNWPLLDRFGYFRTGHEAWYFCTAVICSGEECFPNWLFFLFTYSPFMFCFLLLFFVSECLNTV